MCTTPSSHHFRVRHRASGTPTQRSDAGFLCTCPRPGLVKSSSSCSLNVSTPHPPSSAHPEELPGCLGQVAADAPALRCPPLLPSFAPPWKGGRTAVLAFQAVGRAAAAPACCLADGEIISKPFPSSHPLLLQDHTGFPGGTQSAEPTAEAGQLARLPPSTHPSDPHLSWGKGILGKGI